jgi:hypothetical protein
VNRPLDATVKGILKNQVQGELVPCRVNFRVAAREAVTQTLKLLIPSVVNVQSPTYFACERTFSYFHRNRRKSPSCILQVESINIFIGFESGSYAKLTRLHIKKASFLLLSVTPKWK